jgi:hypothetical protein
MTLAYVCVLLILVSVAFTLHTHKVALSYAPQLLGLVAFLAPMGIYYMLREKE